MVILVVWHRYIINVPYLKILLIEAGWLESCPYLTKGKICICDLHCTSPFEAKAKQGFKETLPTQIAIDLSSCCSCSIWTHRFVYCSSCFFSVNYCSLQLDGSQHECSDVLPLSAYFVPPLPSFIEEKDDYIFHPQHWKHLGNYILQNY